MFQSEVRCRYCVSVASDFQIFDQSDETVKRKSWWLSIIFFKQEKARNRSASLNEAYGQQGFLADSKELVRYDEISYLMRFHKTTLIVSTSKTYLSCTNLWYHLSRNECHLTWNLIKLGSCLNIAHSLQLDWSRDKKRLLEFREKPQDIKTAKQLIDSHKALWEDVNSYKDRYSENQVPYIYMQQSFTHQKFYLPERNNKIRRLNKRPFVHIARNVQSYCIV